MQMQPGHEDQTWTSSGLARSDAIHQWRDWAASTIAPIDVTVFDTEDFAARWTSHGVGQLRLLQLHAPAQRVVHTGRDGSAGRASPTIQPEMILDRAGIADLHREGAITARIHFHAC